MNRTHDRRTFARQMDERPEDDRIERLELGPGDYYFTEEGYMVFTQQYLLRRGTCCGSGCRHCPYGKAPKNKKED